MDSSEIEDFLSALILVFEIYLIFTNLSYAIFKDKYFVPRFVKDKKILKRYRCVTRVGNCSRSGYLAFVTIYTIFEVGWKNDWLSNENFSSHCSFLYLVPFLYLCVTLLCRLWFSWAKSVWIKYCINLSIMQDSNLCSFYSSTICVLFIFDPWMTYRGLDSDCTNSWHNANLMIIFVSWCIYELLSFGNLFVPLHRTTGFFNQFPDEYATGLLTTNQQLDEVETLQNEIEDDQRSLLECNSVGSITPNNPVSLNSSELIVKFQKHVRRNLIAGVLIMLTGILKCAVYLIVLGYWPNEDLTKSSRKDFHNVSFPIIILGIIQYACMMFTDSNWDRAFVPFCCYDRKSWNN